MTDQERRRIAWAVTALWEGSKDVDRAWSFLFRIRDGVHERSPKTMTDCNRYPIITLARVFVTCSACNYDLPSPDGKQDWTLEEVLAVENKSDHSECPMCPECGEFLTVILPEAVEVVG
jgi:hypothetical protein